MNEKKLERIRKAMFELHMALQDSLHEEDKGYNEGTKIKMILMVPEYMLKAMSKYQISTVPTYHFSGAMRVFTVVTQKGMPLKDHVYLQDLEDRNDELAELREKLRRERFTEEEYLEELKKMVSLK